MSAPVKPTAFFSSTFAPPPSCDVNGGSDSVCTGYTPLTPRMDWSVATFEGATETERPFQRESYAKRSVSCTPSAAALALNESRSAFSFALLVPFAAGALESSTNQLVAVSLRTPVSPAPPSPASAGTTHNPAMHSSAGSSRKVLLRIPSPSASSWVSEPSVAWSGISSPISYPGRGSRHEKREGRLAPALSVQRDQSASGSVSTRITGPL